MAETYDIVIIGGGAAGFTAGMYAARDRCKAVVLERFVAGGQVLNCEHIENYPGFPDGIAGYNFGPTLQQQAMHMGVETRLTEVDSVRLEGDLKVLETSQGPLHTQALVIATGSSFARLNIPGEEEFDGRGVSHCASCDAALFTDQAVAVIGGGDAALDEALYLSRYASQVTVVHRRAALRACGLLQERARNNAKLIFQWHTVARAIEGTDTVQALQVENVQSGERSRLAVTGVFPFIGLTPNSGFLQGLVPLNEQGQILTDLSMRTAIPGILAAGDVRSASARQLVSAAGDGATAALAALRYLHTGEWSV